jgi:hypothetical protein
MTDPRHTDPRDSDPYPSSNLRAERGNAAMWGWIAGIAAVVLLAFVLAAGWNNDPQTASQTPPATTGSGATTQTAPPPATTGSGAGAPAMAPQKPAAPAPNSDSN